MLAPDFARLNRNGWFVAAALAVAVIFGGGGSPAPIGELIVQLTAAATAVIWLATLEPSPGKAVPGQAWVIAALLLVIPIIQLIPLPPMVWQALPGREAERTALALIGRENEWRSVSLAPARTLASLLALIPPALLLVMTSALDARSRGRILAVVAACGLLTIVVGAAQLSGGANSPLRYYNPDSTYLEGFQANHNSTADVLLITLLAAVALIRERASRGFFKNPDTAVPWLSLGICALLSVGVFLTGSRAGIMLLIPALAGAGLILRRWLHLGRRGLALGVAGVALIAAAGFGAGTSNPAIAKVAVRFSLGDELRPEIWADSAYTARAHFPVGAGMGNFVPAMLANERLEVVRPNVPNRAHNEFLELLVEAGAFGLVAAAAIAALLARSGYRGLKRLGDAQPGQVLFGAMALSLLALHSLVDYPFRSMSLAMLAAAAAALILPGGAARPHDEQSDRLKSLR